MPLQKSHPVSVLLLFLPAGVVFLLLLSACQPAVESETRYMMGTRVSLRLYPADNGRNPKEDIKKLFAKLARFERMTDVHRYDSLVSRANRRGRIPATGEFAPLYELTLEALKLAMITDGAFDPTLRSLTRLWAFSGPKTRRKPPSRQEVAAALRKTGYERVRVRPEFIDISKTGGLDFGACAKGAGCDLARRQLAAWGYERAILDFGGDLYLLGQKHSGLSTEQKKDASDTASVTDWKVAIRHPRPRANTAFLLCFRAANTAVVSSGDYERFFSYQSRRYHHILDPADGYPARGFISVTVGGPEAMKADAYATAMFVSGPGKALDFIDRMPDYEGFVVMDDVSRRNSKNFTNLFHPVACQ